MKQFWSKSLACLLCLVLLVGMLPVAALTAQDVEHQPEMYAESNWQGEGTADDPYMINDFEDLAALRDAVNGGQKQTGKYFKMTADIDLGDDLWTPIGVYNCMFNGTFDGDGHEITGGKITSSIQNLNQAEKKYQRCMGLFNFIGSNGTVKNLGIGANVTSQIEKDSSYIDLVGSVAAWNFGNIQNCWNNAALTMSTAGTTFAGGIVGYNQNTVTGCWNNAPLTVNTEEFAYVGGVVGYNTINGTVQKSRNTGAVSVTLNGVGDVKHQLYVGGVVGCSEGIVQNCWNNGSVNSTVESTVHIT